jgi:hypothetical protein
MAAQNQGGSHEPNLNPPILQRTPAIPLHSGTEYDFSSYEYKIQYLSMGF